MPKESGLAQAPSVRPYRGVKAAVRLAERRGRLLAAGLDLLGSADHDISELTVRGICTRAGLATRYFYESFSDKDEFVGGVFDWVIADLAATTQAAAAAAPAREQSRAGIVNIVRTIAEDARVGRLLFDTQLANAVVVRKRAESSALFAMLSGQHAGDALRIRANERIKVGAHFAVGGVGQTISAWLAGNVRFEPEELVDQLTSLLNAVADPKLYGFTEKAAAVTTSTWDPSASSHDALRTIDHEDLQQKLEQQRGNHRQPDLAGSGGHQAESRVADRM